MALIGATAGAVHADEIELAIEGGRVTLTATDAPLTDVLAEWARVGETRFIDADKLTAGRVTLQLVDVAETDALRILLRPATGYLAAPRPPGEPGASVYDRVKILASARPPRAAPPRPAPGGDSGAPRGFGGDAPAFGAQSPGFGQFPGQANPGDPTLAVTPDEAAQLEQLQQLLQDPSLPNGAFGRPDFGASDAGAAPSGQRTMPRPGMMIEAPAQEPPRGGRAVPPQASDPFTVFPEPPRR